MVSGIKPLAVVFLDIDGVLTDRLSNPDTRNNTYPQLDNIEASYPIYSNRSLMPADKSRDLLWGRAQARCFSPKALEHLKSLTTRVKALGCKLVFVISSNWKQAGSVAELKDHVFADHPWLSKRIIDKTPDGDSIGDHCKKYGFPLKDVRGREIEFWLRENSTKLNIDRYVILDDVCDGSTEIQTRHPDHFVWVYSDRLFSKQDEDEAFEKLQIPIPSVFKQELMVIPS